MPSYDYEFVDGGGVVTVTHPMSAGPLTEIDGRAVRVLLSAPPVHFRGGGWTEKLGGTSVVRSIYEKNVAEAEPTRRKAAELGLDSEPDDVVIPDGGYQNPDVV